MSGFAKTNPFVNYDSIVEQKENERLTKVKELKPAGNQLKCRNCAHLCDECNKIAKQERENHSISGHGVNDTLCWCCSKVTVDGECEYATYKRPVPGWVAERNKNGYRVIDCPNFKRGRG